MYLQYHQNILKVFEQYIGISIQIFIIRILYKTNKFQRKPKHNTRDNTYVYPDLLTY